MAISENTQAIIDRLRAEGDLIRNSGTNSIRNVKIELEKFAPLFKSIEYNIRASTNILRNQAGIMSDQLEAQRTSEQLAELNSAAATNQMAEDSNTVEKEKEQEKVTVKGIVSDALKFAGISAVGVTGFLVAKGFFDAYGGASKFFEDELGIPVAKLKERFGIIGTAVDKVGAVLNDFAALGLDGVMSFILGSAAITAGVKGIVQGVLGTKLSTGGTLRMGITRSAALMVAGLAYMYADDMKSWLTNLGVDQDWANTTVNLANSAISGMALGAMFGPGGMLVGAIAGFAVGIGYSLYKYLEDRRAAMKAAREKMTADLKAMGLDPEKSESDVSKTINTQYATKQAMNLDLINQDDINKAIDGDEKSQLKVEAAIQTAKDKIIADQDYAPVMASLRNEINTLIRDKLGVEGGLDQEKADALINKLKELKANADPMVQAQAVQLTNQLLKEFQDIKINDEDFAILPKRQKDFLRRVYTELLEQKFNSDGSIQKIIPGNKTQPGMNKFDYDNQILDLQSNNNSSFNEAIKMLSSAGGNNTAINMPIINNVSGAPVTVNEGNRTSTFANVNNGGNGGNGGGFGTGFGFVS